MGTNSDQPLVSIIIPIFETIELFRPMYASIVKQTYEEWELLIVDDGSSERKLQEIQELVVDEPRCKLLQRNRLPKGAPTCRNIGFDNSHGKYIIFFDADDIISEDCIKNRVEFMECNPELDCGVFPAMAFNERIGDCKSHGFGFNLRFNDELKLFILGRLPYVVWNNIYRKDSIVKYGLVWDEALLSLQDSDYDIQQILKGCSIGYSSCDVDYFWRMSSSPKSISKKIQSKSHLESCIYFLNKNLTLIAKYDADLRKYNNVVICRMIDFSIGEIRNGRGFKHSMLSNPYINKNQRLRGWIWVITKIKKPCYSKLLRILSFIFFPSMAFEVIRIVKCTNPTRIAFLERFYRQIQQISNKNEESSEVLAK